MILFVAGIFVGSAVGVIAMCILQVNRKYVKEKENGKY